ncbi:hypothetical protein [Litchfieldia alkalitelluris]|uniref:hypothetical protein n=1 Tax=Litchfieldia alkalitelluris TaxID=304268 RepID=UPI000997B51D|nr:hypothetical protein [Litchfieldia alkalitelluris]
MKIFTGITKILFLYIFVIICITLIVLFPREPRIDVSGGWAGVIDYSYDFNLIDYKNNVTRYFNSVIENKSLGPTKWKTRTVEDELIKFFPRSLLVIGLGFFLCLFFGISKNQIRRKVY